MALFLCLEKEGEGGGEREREVSRLKWMSALNQTIGKCQVLVFSTFTCIYACNSVHVQCTKNWLLWSTSRSVSLSMALTCMCITTKASSRRQKFRATRNRGSGRGIPSHVPPLRHKAAPSVARWIIREGKRRGGVEHEREEENWWQPLSN